MDFNMSATETRSPEMMHFESIVSWVENIVREKSAPGLIVGISGTDSILAYLICAEAMKRLGRLDRLVGVHFGKDYIDPNLSRFDVARRIILNPLYRWVPRIVFPWLREQNPQALLLIDDTIDHSSDHCRWARLMQLATDELEEKTMPTANTGFWVVGTRNATEDALGTYSVISTCASLQPIINLYKTDVLRLCAELGVPVEALNQSRLVDCDCGRFDLAANHLDEVDLLLRAQAGDKNSAHSFSLMESELQSKITAFVQEQQAYSAFKKKIPYTPDISKGYA
jgi:NH3-dependent NAD+ synthetase